MATALSIVQSFYPRVETIRDAKKNAHVTVEKTDGKGNQKNHRACAVAQACTRQFHLDGAVVSRAAIYLVKGKVATRYRSSQAIKQEITGFDRSGVFTPGTYTLAKPNPSHALGSWRKRTDPGKSGSSTKGTGKRRMRNIVGLRQSLQGGAPR